MADLHAATSEQQQRQAAIQQQAMTEQALVKEQEHVAELHQLHATLLLLR